MMTAKEKYLNDPEYHALVTHMIKMIDTLQFTPSEMREAAMLACLIYEETKNPIYDYAVKYLYKGEK